MSTRSGTNALHGSAFETNRNNAIGKARQRQDFYSKAPGNKPDKAAGEALDRLFAAIENPAKYDAKQFAAEVKAFEKNLK